MELNKGDIINLNESKYIIIELLNYNNKKYAFVNELNINDEIGKDYYILEIIGKNAKKVTDVKHISVLLEKFKIIINKDIDNIIKINESEG